MYMTRRVCASCSARCWWGSCLRNAFLPFPFLCLQLRHPTPSPQKCSLIPTKRLQLLVFQQVTKMNIYVLQRLQILFSLVNILLSVFCQQDNKGVKLRGGGASGVSCFILFHLGSYDCTLASQILWCQDTSHHKQSRTRASQKRPKRL